MSELSAKLKRVKPLIKAKKAELDREAALLSEIRQAKIAAIARLKEYQRKYIEGVDMLNRERQAGQLGKLPTLESGLDLVRSRWFESLKEVRTYEAQEKAQIAQVQIAQVNFKSMEKLEERYAGQLSDFLKKKEQKEIDEMTVMRHKPTTSR